MRIRLVKQPGAGTLGSELRRHLAREDLRRFDVAVAWMSRQAVGSLAEEVHALAERTEPATCRALVGVDLGGTTQEALELAAGLFDEVKVFHDAGGRLFHPKFYLFDFGAISTVFLGSGNFTANGLFRGFELTSAIDLDVGDPADAALLDELSAWYEALWSDPNGSLGVDESVIDRLVADPAIDLPSERDRPPIFRPPRRNDGDGPRVFRDPVNIAIGALDQGAQPEAASVGVPEGPNPDPEEDFEFPMRTLEGASDGRGRIRKRKQRPKGAELLESEKGRWDFLQRFALGREGDALLLCAWPGEQAAQARALYRREITSRLLDFLGGQAEWSARPKPHLAYPFSQSRGGSFYLTCALSPEEYVARWSEPDAFERIGGSSPISIRADLWPWLCDNGLAYQTDADDGRLDRFIAEAEPFPTCHLRPGLEFERTWSWARAVEAGPTRFAAEVRDSMNVLLSALDGGRLSG